MNQILKSVVAADAVGVVNKILGFDSITGSGHAARLC